VQKWKTLIRDFRLEFQWRSKFRNGECIEVFVSCNRETKLIAKLIELFAMICSIKISLDLPHRTAPHRISTHEGIAYFPP
jgi:hypothetical protein